ncbi:hypothetical protein FHS43_003474 [Streptosporangium becharense]|uniref:Uncharacterized protein n=1 Tax=Streptosporangium becharense TaxID=1816182 RepID=A0A7W9MFQ1_9ACTN|nr:hypothetical protein [Streptosporangium becharense]MBB2912194.1 hypothetical protein [Streptosporangium becharense]MBB5818741.1 hypothetical protein [Streptosporangium becharense]
MTCKSALEDSGVMGVFDFLLARRLRRGPTLLLPSSVTPQDVLEAVRLRSPEAASQGGAIRTGDGVRLRGPYSVCRELALLTGLPVGWPVAYVVDAPGTERETDPATVVAGLAERLGGLCCPRHPARSPDLFTVTGGALPLERLTGLLPGARPRTVPGFDITLLSADRNPLEITFCGGEDGEVDYEVSVAHGPITSAVVEQAERLALAIGEASGGVVRDRNGFRLGIPVG